MKFSKLLLTAGALVSIIAAAGIANAKTVNPIVDKRGNPVQDHRGNCARTKWLADQCCDPCGYPVEEVKPIVVEKERKIPYIDLVRQSIYFVIDKDNIDQTDEQRMQEVMNEINKSVGIRDVKLVGYADRFATNKYNIDLSKRRATHVLDYFRGKGYFNNVTVGFGFFGEEKPVTNCPTNVPVPEQVACLQADRRVDIEVELLRERVDIIKETVAPAYPRPGTAGVEVYSRPVDPNSIRFTAPEAAAPANNVPMGAPMNAPASIPETMPAPVTPVQSLDTLRN